MGRVYEKYEVLPSPHLHNHCSGEHIIGMAQSGVFTLYEGPDSILAVTNERARNRHLENYRHAQPLLLVLCGRGVRNLSCTKLLRRRFGSALVESWVKEGQGLRLGPT